MYGEHTGTGMTVWLTGMQGAGKRSLAREVANRLRRMGKPVEVLDGPEWEKFIGKGPGTTKEDRNAIVLRAGFVARALTRAGGIVLVPQVSPYREIREALRRDIGRFIEVFVDCSIQALMDRDTSGQYERAMRGEIRNFIGVTDPYEPPAMAEVRYDSSKQRIDDGADEVMEALVREGVLEPSDLGLTSLEPKPKPKKSKKAPEPILFAAEALTLPAPSAREPEPEPAPVAPKAEPKAAATRAAPAKTAAKTSSKKPAAKKPAARAAPKAAAKAAPARRSAPAKTTKAPAKKAAPKKVAAKTARVSAKKPAAKSKR